MQEPTDDKNILERERELKELKEIRFDIVFTKINNGVDFSFQILFLEETGLHLRWWKRLSLLKKK